MLEGITLNGNIKASQHVAKVTPGAPGDTAKYCWERSTDAVINNFLDFLQHGAVNARCRKWYKNG